MRQVGLVKPVAPDGRGRPLETPVVGRDAAAAVVRGDAHGGDCGVGACECRNGGGAGTGSERAPRQSSRMGWSCGEVPQECPLGVRTVRVNLPELAPPSATNRRLPKTVIPYGALTARCRGSPQECPLECLSRQGQSPRAASGRVGNQQAVAQDRHRWQWVCRGEGPAGVSPRVSAPSGSISQSSSPRSATRRRLSKSSHPDLGLSARRGTRRSVTLGVRTVRVNLP